MRGGRVVIKTRPFYIHTDIPPLSPPCAVKCPGALVVTLYAACDDIRLPVTLDLKATDSILIYPH
jgi:hypothetical protein